MQRTQERKKRRILDLRKFEQVRAPRKKQDDLLETTVKRSGAEAIGSELCTLRSKLNVETAWKDAAVGRWAAVETTAAEK
jgi:hypothetical protein